MMGMEDGAQKAEWKAGQRNIAQPSNKSPHETCFITTTPKLKASAFPTSFKNLKDDSIMLANIPKFIVKVNNPEAKPLWLSIVSGFRFVIAFIVLGLLIFIPIQVYKITRSIVKNEIFYISTISRLRGIGYSLLILFICYLYDEFVSFLEGKFWISLEEYNIVFSIKENCIFLLFGLITLLFAEILKISHSMKVEQDLTI
jgi:hypothetical protein